MKQVRQKPRSILAAHVSVQAFAILMLLAAVPFARGLTLEEARERAFAHSPALRAAASEAQAAEGALRQAGAWPNPEIEMEAENFGGDLPGWDESEWTLSLSQPLALFGERGARAEAARHGREAAALALEAREFDLLTEVDRRFARALAAGARVAAAEESDRIAADIVQAVNALVQAGEVSPIEEDRAEAERAGVAIELRNARLEEETALRQLAELWGARAGDVESLEGSLEIDATSPAPGSSAAAAESSPDWLRGKAQERSAQAAVAQAKRAVWPEIAVRGGIRRANGEEQTSFVAGVGFELPLFDRGGGAIEEARARLAQVRAERAAEESRILLARETAYAALSNAIETARTVREIALPRAQAIHDAVQEGYRRGKFSLLDMLDARRSLEQARLQSIDAWESVWFARADLERLLATHRSSNEGGSR